MEPFGADANPRTPDVLGGLRITGIAFAAVALTIFFMVLGFPYDRLAQRIATSIERDTGTRIVLGPISVGLVRWAPGLEADGVQILQPDGTRYDLTEAGVRPALSLSWLAGTPTLAIDLVSERGDASGRLTLGETPGYDGNLTHVDLEMLPQTALGTPLQVQGRADADIDIVVTPEGPIGAIAFEARDGVFTHPELPLPMPFQKLEGEIDLGGEDWARIRSFTLESPLANGRARGTIGRAPSFATAPLRLQLELTVSSAIQGSLNAQGVEVGRSGEIRIEVTGTPARPVVR
jgi:type II secretion system protein N